MKRLSTFRRQISLNPKNPAFYIACGQIYFQESQLEEAATAYKKAIALNENSLPAHQLLGNVRFAQKKLKLAERHYKTAIELGSQGHLGYVSRSVALHRGKRIPIALSTTTSKQYHSTLTILSFTIT